MRKTITTRLILGWCAAAFTLVAAPRLSAQGVDEIVARIIEARGGEERLRQASSFRLKGSVTLAGGILEGTFVWTQARPNLIRSDMRLGDFQISQGYDGGDAWELKSAIFGGSGTAESLPDAMATDFVESADFDGPLVDYQQKGHQIELAGREKIDGRDVLHLRVERKSGKVLQQYIDAATFVPVKVVSTEFNPQAGRELQSIQLFSEFKVVDGINVPHRVESRLDGQVVMSLQVESVEWDVEVEEGLFKRP